MVHASLYHFISEISEVLYPSLASPLPSPLGSFVSSPVIIARPLRTLSIEPLLLAVRPFEHVIALVPIHGPVIKVLVPAMHEALSQEVLPPLPTFLLVCGGRHVGFIDQHGAPARELSSRTVLFFAIVVVLGVTCNPL